VPRTAGVLPGIMEWHHPRPAWGREPCATRSSRSTQLLDPFGRGAATLAAHRTFLAGNRCVNDDAPGERFTAVPAVRVSRHGRVSSDVATTITTWPCVPRPVRPPTPRSAAPHRW
jgi:hypothetical protein